MPELYVYPSFSGIDLGVLRLRGVGLGNLLFPWARCVVASHKRHLKMIAPTWPQICPGAFLRLERDKRSYHNAFLSPRDQVQGVRKLWLLATLPRYFDESASEASRGIICFRGTSGGFAPILEDAELVRQQLLTIVRRHHKDVCHVDFQHSISIHVRRGDFRTPSGTNDIYGGCNGVRIPLSWYVDVISRLRDLVGREIPVFVFSDGTNEELADLLAIPGVQRLGCGSAIADLVALTRANVLIASGSSFSMWASYLGRMPVIWHKGQMLQRLYRANEAIECEDASGQSLPTELKNSFAPSPARGKGIPAAGEESTGIGGTGAVGHETSSGLRARGSRMF